MVEAEYDLDWYELAQTITVGEMQEIHFFKDVEPLTFYCGLWYPKKAICRNYKIEQIIHPVLGNIQSINTRGLDYTITLITGEQLTVNAEEEPGKVYNYHIQPESWVFNVLLSTNT